VHDKQLLHKKQFSCNKISQIAALSTPKHSLYDKSQTQIVDPLQIVQMDECNESSEFGPQEMNVQSKNSKLFYFFQLIHNTYIYIYDKMFTIDTITSFRS